MLPIQKILCPIDFSEPSLAALDAACELARHFDAEVQVLHVLPLLVPFPAEMMAMAGSPQFSDRERCNEALRDIEEVIAARVPHDVRAQSVVKLGSAPHEIVSTADEEKMDLIVIGTHGSSGWRHLAFGAVADKAVRMAHRPVLTIHDPKTKPLSELVGPADETTIEAVPNQAARQITALQS